MDAVTHSMTGLLIGSIAAVKKDKLYPLLLTGAVASVLPDLDAVIKFVSIDFFFKYHRLFTHTVFATPILAALAALPAWRWARGHYLLFYLIALISILFHLCMDVVCRWEIYLFYPLSKKDFAMNLFNNKDTSYIVLFITTISAMGMLYYHNYRQLKQSEGVKEEKAD